MDSLSFAQKSMDNNPRKRTKPTWACERAKQRQTPVLLTAGMSRSRSRSQPHLFRFLPRRFSSKRLLADHCITVYPVDYFRSTTLVKYYQRLKLGDEFQLEIKKGEQSSDQKWHINWRRHWGLLWKHKKSPYKWLKTETRLNKLMKAFNANSKTWYSSESRERKLFLN